MLKVVRDVERPTGTARRAGSLLDGNSLSFVMVPGRCSRRRCRSRSPRMSTPVPARSRKWCHRLVVLTASTSRRMRAKSPPDQDGTVSCLTGALWCQASAE